MATTKAAAKKGPPRATRKDGKTFPIHGTKTKVRVPRKAATAKKPPARKKQDSIGESMVHTWADGSGTLRVGASTVAMMKGEVDLSEWTDEELIRGARKGVSRLPHVVPLQIHNELCKRVLTQVKHRFVAEMEMAVREHIRIINSRKTSPETKLKAIGMLYDRVLGKPMEHVTVEHDIDPLYKQVIARAIVATPEQAAVAIASLGDGDSAESQEIIDGELVDEDEEESATA